MINWSNISCSLGLDDEKDRQTGHVRAVEHHVRGGPRSAAHLEHFPDEDGKKAGEGEIKICFYAGFGDFPK